MTMPAARRTGGGRGRRTGRGGTGGRGGTARRYVARGGRGRRRDVAAGRDIPARGNIPAGGRRGAAGRGAHPAAGGGGDDDIATTAAAAASAEKSAEETAAEPTDWPTTDHHRRTAAAARIGRRRRRQIRGRHRHHRHLRPVAAGAADDLAHALGGARRFTPGDAAHRTLLHRFGAGDLGHLQLVIRGLRRLGFRHVDGTAADDRAARRAGRQFRKGHPNRHTRCSLYFRVEREGPCPAVASICHEQRRDRLTRQRHSQLIHRPDAGKVVNLSFDRGGCVETGLSGQAGQRRTGRSADLYHRYSLTRPNRTAPLAARWAGSARGAASPDR